MHSLRPSPENGEGEMGHFKTELNSALTCTATWNQAVQNNIKTVRNACSMGGWCGIKIGVPGLQVIFQD